MRNMRCGLKNEHYHARQSGLMQQRYETGGTAANIIPAAATGNTEIKSKSEAATHE